MAATTTVIRSRPASSSLYDVVDLILDKGLVIDAYLRVSLVGIEVLSIDLRVVVASVDTYLRFAEVVDRVVLEEKGKGLPELAEGVTRGAARGRSGGLLEGVADAVGAPARRVKGRVEEAVSGDDGGTGAPGGQEPGDA